MNPSAKSLVALETRFWQALVGQDADAATELLCEPAIMVSAHGAMQFDHAGYRKMVDQGRMVVTSFAFDDMQVMFPNDTTAILTYHVTQGVASRGKTKAKLQEMTDSSTWIQQAGKWKCVMHTETPMDKKPNQVDRYGDAVVGFRSLIWRSLTERLTSRQEFVFEVCRD